MSHLNELGFSNLSILSTNISLGYWFTISYNFLRRQFSVVYQCVVWELMFHTHDEFIVFLLMAFYCISSKL